MKPTSSYVREGSSVEIPPSCTFLDHEVELGVVIGKKGRDIPESQAMDHISGMLAIPFMSFISSGYREPAPIVGIVILVELAEFC